MNHTEQTEIERLQGVLFTAQLEISKETSNSALLQSEISSLKEENEKLEREVELQARSEPIKKWTREEYQRIIDTYSRKNRIN